MWILCEVVLKNLVVAILIDDDVLFTEFPILSDIFLRMHNFICSKHQKLEKLC